MIFNIRKVDKLLISFGGYSSYLPSLFGRLFHKKVAIIVHGTDCVSFPQINYGSLQKPVMRWFIHKSYNFANIILPVSESLVSTNNTYYCDEVLRFGYNIHLSNIHTPHKVIPNGLIIDDWKQEDRIKLNKTFITVMTNDQIERKGGRLIIKAARSLKDCKFYFAGTNEIESLDVPDNVIFLGKLLNKYSRFCFK